MSRSTGPIVATGLVTLINEAVFHAQPVDWRVPVATGLAAIGFELAERVWPTGAVLLAWTAFITVMFTRVNPAVPGPAESALSWWNSLEGATS